MYGRKDKCTLKHLCNTGAKFHVREDKIKS